LLVVLDLFDAPEALFFHEKNLGVRRKGKVCFYAQVEDGMRLGLREGCAKRWKQRTEVRAFLALPVTAKGVGVE